MHFCFLNDITHFSYLILFGILNIVHIKCCSFKYRSFKCSFVYCLYHIYCVFIFILFIYFCWAYEPKFNPMDRPIIATHLGSASRISSLAHRMLGQGPACVAHGPTFFSPEQGQQDPNRLLLVPRKRPASANAPSCWPAHAALFPPVSATRLHRPILAIMSSASHLSNCQPCDPGTCSSLFSLPHTEAMDVTFLCYNSSTSMAPASTCKGPSPSVRYNSSTRLATSPTAPHSSADLDLSYSYRHHLQLFLPCIAPHSSFNFSFPMRSHILASLFHSCHVPSLFSFPMLVSSRLELAFLPHAPV